MTHHYCVIHPRLFYLHMPNTLPDKIRTSDKPAVFSAAVLDLERP